MRFFNFLFLLTIFSCQQDKQNLNPLENVLQSENPTIQNVVDSLDNYEVQIKLSEVLRAGDTISFKDYDFNVDDSNYFYPASSVKFPIAVLALEKVFNMPQVTSTTPYVIEDDSIQHNIRDDIRQIFAVSDNDAYNRLFEFMGRDYINQMLRTKNLGPVRISHRLSVPNSNYNTTKSISFWQNDSIFYIQDSIVNKPIKTVNLNRQQKGQGFYKDSILINEPMDFSEKNYLPITTLHNMMKSVIFPEKFPAFKTFEMELDDRNFLLESMKALPRSVGYDEKDYYDGYVKFFMFGDQKNRIPDNIEIFNKVGYAYGYLTDCAYIKDTETNSEFILTATIHVNKNGIFNDDTYEYDEIGIPFLANLGREIHDQLKQKNESN